MYPLYVFDLKEKAGLGPTFLANNSKVNNRDTYNF